VLVVNRVHMIGAPVSFYSRWQPLDSEDAQTALVFGFMRHAPPEVALAPWLTDVLGHPVTGGALAPGAFWPSVPSVLADHDRTVPDVVFEASDGQPLLVVIESKLGAGQHGFEQLVREAIDTAHATGAERLAVVMVGADIGMPPQTEGWELAIAKALVGEGLEGVDIMLRYSSWARLGHWIEACAAASPEWSTYAEDVVAQLYRHGQLGYKGAPVFDDLDGLSVVNAVEAVNRTTKQARQFFLALTGHTRFGALGLKPLSRSFEMLRDGGGTRSLNQEEDWFTTSTLLSPFRKPEWDPRAGVFAAFYLAADDEPDLNAGLFWADPARDFQYGFAWSETVDESELESIAEVGSGSPMLAEITASSNTEWRYATRSWRSGDPDGDVDWTLDVLEAASSAWDHAG
jgi:hypothetical protein